MVAQRWAAGVEYLGTRYCGWQRQSHCVSVQQHVEAALSAVADHPVQVVAAGRTDAGVHGFGQCIHFDAACVRSARAWLLGANKSLPSDISLRWAVPVTAGFHARYGALSRSYRYLICNQPTRSALLDGRAAWEVAQLDAQAMHEAAQCLLGAHDFSAFRGVACQARNAVRRVESVSIRRHDNLLSMDIRANAFLLHMVRNIVGSLIDVGTGKRPVAWIAELLASRKRTLAGRNAPACGLYFVGAQYPAEFQIPESREFWLP